MHSLQVLTDIAGRLAFHFAQIQPFIPTYTHLLVSALFPIYAGSHASLTRPSSAAKPAKADRKDGEPAPGDEEEEEPVQKMEGLQPSDAIVFPFLAGSTLAGLYFVIKWLEDPALLNKILNWYFATFSVLSVARLVSDGLDVLHSLIFPHDFVDAGILFHVDAKKKIATSADAKVREVRHSPLPGPFSRLPLPSKIMNVFWFLYVVPNRKLKIEFAMRKIIKAEVKLGVHGIEGILVGLSTVIFYNFVSKPWYLTNLMGFGFAYGALQLLSPTTFWTGSLILNALFFYDIYFVFYTPMMVSVAKSLDIPIKLLFPAPPRPDADPTKQSLSMLGLGDVVLPGIVIGLALRFDLYMHYLRKQRKATTSDTTAVTSESARAPYKSVAEGWGDQIWTSSLVARILAPMAPTSPASRSYTPRNAFPRPYFHASLVGYVVGMLATLFAMQVSDHPQPALLYLVPGVLGSVWGTALVRSEVKEMWRFSDAAEEEKEAEKKKKVEEEKKAAGEKEMKEAEAGKEVDGALEIAEPEVQKSEGTGRDDKASTSSKDSSAKNGPGDDDRTLFSFRITLPPAIPTPATDNDSNALIEGTNGTLKAIQDDSDEAEGPGLRRRTTRHSTHPHKDQRSDDEHQDKRVRTK